jgi:glycosyltransferase involved in cell wall biosynthesis
VRLGVVTTSYPRGPLDPAGSFVAAHVRALRALGHQVDVIAAGAPCAEDVDVERLGGDLFEHGGAPDHLERHPVRSLGAAARFCARLTAIVTARAHRWDSIVAHWLVPSALAALPSRIPLLAIAHGGDIYTLRRMHLLAPALHALHARRAQLVFVSEQLRAIARAAAPGLARWLASATVQPMGLDLDRFGAIVRAPADPPVLVVAARLVPIKGVDVAIDALAHLGPDARLVIAGDGPDRAALESRARSRDRRVSFLGTIGPDHRDRLLGDASVVVVPSRVLPGGRSEGTPMIALEALAAGVPVVASAVGGLRELAPTVELADPDDPYALATGIQRVLRAPPSSTALRSAVAHLAWNRVVTRLVRSV